jgi:hypothetical protein
MSDDVASLRVPVFDGETKNFQSWWIRFQAYARVKQFGSVLKEHEDLPSSEEEIAELDPANTEERKKIATGKRNMLAMAHLTMALGTESLLNKVSAVCDEQWPGGLAWKLVDKLKEQYQPKDRVAGVEMKRKLNAVSMKKKDKPSKLFDQIKSIENQYSEMIKKLDEEDKIAIVFEKAPAEYSGILAATEKEKGQALKMEDLEIAMGIQYRIRYGDTEDDKDNNEISLSAFEGSCYHCKEKGHRANECPKKRGKFRGKCRGCGKTGHKLADCWANNKNKNKRPEWYNKNKNKEKGLSARDDDDDDGTEYLLMAINMCRIGTGQVEGFVEGTGQVDGFVEGTGQVDGFVEGTGQVDGFVEGGDQVESLLHGI